jgi:hypothetical protein
MLPVRSAKLGGDAGPASCASPSVPSASQAIVAIDAIRPTTTSIARSLAPDSRHRFVAIVSFPGLVTQAS